MNKKNQEKEFEKTRLVFKRGFVESFFPRSIVPASMTHVDFDFFDFMCSLPIKHSSFEPDGRKKPKIKSMSMQEIVDRFKLCPHCGQHLILKGMHHTCKRPKMESQEEWLKKIS